MQTKHTSVSAKLNELAPAGLRGLKQRLVWPLCRICFVNAFIKGRCTVEFSALGIAAKSPQRSEDLKRKARPAGERPKRN